MGIRQGKKPMWEGGTVFKRKGKQLLGKESTNKRKTKILWGSGSLNLKRKEVQEKWSLWPP